MYHYRVFGIDIISEVCIPFLTNLKSVEKKNALFIKYNRAMPSIEYEYVEFLGMKYSGEIRAYNTECATVLCYESNIMLSINKSGLDITIVCHENDLQEALLYCFTSGIIISLYYRGYFVLHASSFIHDEKVYAFVGDSGVGKSTLLFSMLDKGCSVYSDDITPIKNGLVASNGDLPYKLWSDSIDLIKNRNYSSEEMLAGMKKYWIRLNDNKMVTNEHPIKCLFVLKPKTEQYCNISIKELSIFDIIEELLSNLHAYWCLPNENKKLQIEYLNELRNNTKVVYLEYPKQIEMLNELTDHIIKYIDTL